MYDAGTEAYSPPPGKHPLETADAVARAAHLWVRSLCRDESFAPGERNSLAGGLVAGLCDRLELDPRVRELVAYVYAFLDEEGGQALAVSRMMLTAPVPKTQRKAFERGRDEAAAIVEMIAYHGRTN